jgi:hypothetical protein
MSTESVELAASAEGELIFGGFRFAPTQLVPIGQPDFEDWDRVGVFLRYVHTGSQFWLGDWLNFGEAAYGEKYAQAVEHTGYELSTLQTYAWVARQVQNSNRLQDVPFGHYLNGIAALDMADQRAWIQRVVNENLSQAKLRQLLAEERAANGQQPVDLWLVVKCKDQKDFDKLEKQMREQGREVASKVTVRKVNKKVKSNKTPKEHKRTKKLKQ